MEELILDVLTKKGALREKKLRARVFEEISETAEGVSLFEKTIARLKESHRLLVSKDKDLTINKVEQDKERRSDADLVVENALIERLRASKKAETGDDDDGSDSPLKKARVDGGNGKKWHYPEMWSNGERYWRENAWDPEYLRLNPEGITRIFVGNLNRKVTEEEICERLPGVTFIKWITDKETGAFYGSSFLEMKDAKSASEAVMQDKTKFMGRPMKIYYCPPRPTDTWPPVEANRGLSNLPNRTKAAMQAAEAGNTAVGASGTPRPEGCTKLFAGNLSYEIDDDTMVAFFADCGPLVGLRWLTHKDSGDFKGCGYVQFATAAEAEKAILKNGEELLGRKIRLDWTN